MIVGYLVGAVAYAFTFFGSNLAVLLGALIVGVVHPLPAIFVLVIPFSALGFFVLSRIETGAWAVAMLGGAIVGPLVIGSIFYAMRLYSYHFRPEINSPEPSIFAFANLASLGIPAGAIAGWVFWRLAFGTHQERQAK